MKKSRFILLLAFILINACKNNPFGEDMYYGKIMDETSHSGIPGATVMVMGKKKEGQGYHEFGRCETDQNGDYKALYKRKSGYIYRIYASKAFYSNDDPDNYAWGDRKRTDVMLKPFGFLKVRMRHVTGDFESVVFADLIHGAYPSVVSMQHPDTTICCFKLPANRDINFIYFLNSGKVHHQKRERVIRIRSFETDSLCINY